MQGIVRRNLVKYLWFSKFKPRSIPIAPISTLYQEQEQPDVDLAIVFSSERFFFSCPGRTSSIMDSSFSFKLPPPTSSISPLPPVLDTTVLDNNNNNIGTTVIGGGVAVSIFSEQPYVDFRRSMEEMVVAGNLFDVNSNWESLHDLLICYLVLNSKHTHNLIVHAFSDLLSTLTYGEESSSS